MRVWTWKYDGPSRGYCLYRAEERVAEWVGVTGTFEDSEKWCQVLVDACNAAEQRPTNIERLRELMNEPPPIDEHRRLWKQLMANVDKSEELS